MQPKEPHWYRPMTTTGGLSNAGHREVSMVYKMEKNFFSAAPSLKVSCRCLGNIPKQVPGSNSKLGGNLTIHQTRQDKKSGRVFIVIRVIGLWDAPTVFILPFFHSHRTPRF